MNKMPVCDMCDQRIKGRKQEKGTLLCHNQSEKTQSQLCMKENKYEKKNEKKNPALCYKI